MAKCGPTSSRVAKRILCSTFVYGTFEFIVKTDRYARVSATTMKKANLERCALLELTLDGLLDGGKPPRLTQLGIDFVLDNYETFKDEDGREITLVNETPPNPATPWDPKWGAPDYDSII